MAILAKMQRTSRGPTAMADGGEENFKDPGDYETCRVGKCTFTFPVEMLELENLKGVLSVETWDRLTEEQREKLVGFLPAGEVNQEEFQTMLKQLLGGENFYFGNPVDGFLDRMKKGWLHPSVTGYRNGYHDLQKREHAFQVRSYHDGMVKRFMEMQKLWEDYPDVDIGDRIKIWRKWKETNVKPEYPPNNLKEGGSASHKAKSSSGKKATAAGAANGKKAAGILKVCTKVKAVKQEDVKPPKVVPLQKLAKCTPKGVLKTTKKATMVQQQQPDGSDTDTSTGDDESPPQKTQQQQQRASSSLSSGKKRKNSVSPEVYRKQKKSKDVDSGTSSDGIVSPKAEPADYSNGPVLEARIDSSEGKKHMPRLPSSFPFSAIHFLSAVRRALVSPYGGSPVREVDENGSDNDRGVFNMVPLAEIVRRVHASPGDPRVLEAHGTQLQDLVWGALKAFSSKTSPGGGSKGWKPLAVYEKETKSWCWVGSSTSSDASSDDWGISSKMLVKLEESFSTWYRNGEETRQQLVQLQGPPPVVSTPVDERERFRDMRAQKSLITITPSSNDMREYFRKEEAVRYSVPDRAFTYRRCDGQKSVVAPLRRGGGKPNSKAREHKMLKPNRPPHVTILCLVRDAAARLPGGVGTRADVCALIRDSQYVVEEVPDKEVNAVVSGALDRLHYEVDPCVRFDSDRKLWMYLHTDRSEEDFDDEGTSSTKRWKKQKKDGVEDHSNNNSSININNTNLRHLEECSPSGMEFQDGSCGGGLENMANVNNSNQAAVAPPQCAIYSADRTELVYSKSSSLSSPRVLHNSLVVEEETMIEPLPPPSSSPAAKNDEAEQVAWHSIGTVWSEEAEQRLKEEQRLREQEAAKAAAEAAAAGGSMDVDEDDDDEDEEDDDDFVKNVGSH